MFSRYAISNLRFVLLVLVSLGLTLFVTELTFLQRIFDTVSLTSRQWGISLLAVAIAVVVVEIAKFILRRAGWASVAPAQAEVVSPATAPMPEVQPVP
jgi:Ca2+-transporting ATPase